MGIRSDGKGVAVSNRVAGRGVGKNLEGGTPSQGSGGSTVQSAENQRHVSSPSSMTVTFLLCLFGTSVESWDEGGVKALKEVKFLFGNSSERLAGLIWSH